jgi:hypothetical protein
LENRKRFLPLHSRNEGKKKAETLSGKEGKSQSDFGSKQRES